MSQLKISNGQVVERVMRMGVEHRSGIPECDLWDLAVRQLHEESKRPPPATHWASFEAWLADPTPIKYAMTHIGSKLTVLRVTAATAMKFIEWRMNIPFVELQEIQNATI